jgi:hypothetical protein
MADVIMRVDDMTGEPVSDEDGGERIPFGHRGKHYYIDLTKVNAAAFDEVMDQFITRAHRDTETERRLGRPGSRRSRGQAAGEIRAWARGQGIHVSERGRIPAGVIGLYEHRNDPPAP